MHRFYFHLHECGAWLRDDEGRELPSFEAAFEEALRIARLLIAEDVTSGCLCLDSRIEIADSYGIALATVAFKEVVVVTGHGDRLQR